MSVRGLASMFLCAMLGLAGCSTTVFESLPAGTTTDCDPAWPGHWLPQATTTGEAPSQASAEISADCHSVTSKGETKPLHLTLVDTGRERYLQVHNESGGPDCIGEGKAHCGWTLLRYEREGDVIRVYDPDHARIAAAIRAGKLAGYSEDDEASRDKTSEPVFRNYVAGDGTQVARLLHRHPEYFARKSFMVLRRVAAVAAVPADSPRQEP